jgi:tetratricopeptide (TPR) repeat protein
MMMDRYLLALFVTAAMAAGLAGCKSKTEAKTKTTAPPAALASADPAAANENASSPPTLPPGAKAGPLDLSKVGPHDETYAHESLSADKWAEVALMYQTKGQYGEALSTLDQALAHYPESAHLYAVRGALWLQLEEYSKAVADLKKSLELQEDPGVRVNYAEALRRFNRKKEAIENLDRALEDQPDYFPALFNRGVLRYELGDNEGALADFNKAIEVDPEAAAPYFNRAAVLWLLGKKKEAIADLNTFIAKAPKGEWRDTAKDLRQTWQEQLEADQ